MSRPEPGWFDLLPTERLIAEFSTWSADALRLGHDLERIRLHADLLHVDVADGHFAPSFLFFPDQVARMRSVSSAPIHVHLMVSPVILLEQIDQFAEAGADAITVHAESPNTAQAVARIRHHGLLPGIVLRVETPVSALEPYLNDVQFVTLLGTAIGVKGKGLHEEALNRLREARELIARNVSGRRVVLVADGGIRHETVPLLREAGAEGVVLGSLAFGDPDLKARMEWLASL
jgi:ribulose-phosphate 3-epimerase